MNGKGYFLNGPNIAWHFYGSDFGAAEGKDLYDPLWWEGTFQNVSAYGGNSVRIWIHCDGRANPVFNAEGECVGLNHGLVNDLNDLLKRAKNHRIMVILTLWDFYIKQVPGRLDLVKNDTKLQTYLNNCLEPLVGGVEHNDNLIAWEAINEPEWLTTGNEKLVTWEQMQHFVGGIAATVHKASKKYVTVGSASLKWNSDVLPAEGNFWKDSALQKAYPDKLAKLDIYQVHYYDWMYPWGYSPFAKDISYWKLDKLVLVGESGQQEHYPFSGQYNTGL